MRMRDQWKSTSPASTGRQPTSATNMRGKSTSRTSTEGQSTSLASMGRMSTDGRCEDGRCGDGQRAARGNTTRGARGQRGSVTAETAIVLPVVVLLLIAGMWAIGVVVANIRCVDAARDVARAVARGEPPETARAIGERAAPPGADIEVNRTDSDVAVRVSADIRLDWPVLEAIPSVLVEGRATVQVEPTMPEAGVEVGREE